MTGDVRLALAGDMRLALSGASDHPRDLAAGPDRPGIAYAELRTDTRGGWLARYGDDRDVVGFRGGAQRQRVACRAPSRRGRRYGWRDGRAAEMAGATAGPVESYEVARAIDGEGPS